MSYQLKAGLTHEDIYKRFTDKFMEIAKDVMSDVVGEYLPHAESDLDSNIYYRSMDYIADNFEGHSIFGNAGQRFRQHIFEENKELIIAQLDQDNLEKIAQLERELSDMRRQLLEWRVMG